MGSYCSYVGEFRGDLNKKWKDGDELERQFEFKIPIPTEGLGVGGEGKGG